LWRRVGTRCPSPWRQSRRGDRGGWGAIMVMEGEGIMEKTNKKTLSVTVYSGLFFY
jgi:hypothetical protein